MALQRLLADRVITGPATGGDPASDDPARDVTRLTASEPVAAAEAADAAEACFGLRGDLTRLPGEADDNFLLATATGAPGGTRYVVSSRTSSPIPGSWTSRSGRCGTSRRKTPTCPSRA